MQNKIDLKGLKRGDKVIAINEHTLVDKTYAELQQIVHQLNPQQQIKLTIERRQWRQYGMSQHRRSRGLILNFQPFRNFFFRTSRA